MRNRDLDGKLLLIVDAAKRERNPSPERLRQALLALDELDRRGYDTRHHRNDLATLTRRAS